MNLRDFLDFHGLGEWIGTFERERINLATLPELTDTEIQSLGLPWGVCERLLLAIRGGSSTAESAGSGDGFLGPVPSEDGSFLGDLPDWAPAWASGVGEDQFGRWAELKESGIIQRLRWIAPGNFLMGSSRDEQALVWEWMRKSLPHPAPESGAPKEPQHPVTLTRGFWLADTPCTQGLWQAVMGKNPSAFPDDPLRPVEQVSWNDCQLFFDQLRACGSGLSPQLPTEAQWEYACRAGTTTTTYAGPLYIQGLYDAPILDGIAWYAGNSGMNPQQGVLRYDASDGPERPCDTRHAGSHRVGEKRPNPWGLYDMIGNVWELCADWYDDYPAGPVTDPTGPASGSLRVDRGASWFNYAASCRAALRYGVNPGIRLNCLGFRFCIPGQ